MLRIGLSRQAPRAIPEGVARSLLSHALARNRQRLHLPAAIRCKDEHHPKRRPANTRPRILDESILREAWAGLLCPSENLQEERHQIFPSEIVGPHSCHPSRVLLLDSDRMSPLYAPICGGGAAQLIAKYAIHRQPPVSCRSARMRRRRMKIQLDSP